MEFLWLTHKTSHWTPTENQKHQEVETAEPKTCASIWDLRLYLDVWMKSRVTLSIPISILVYLEMILSFPSIKKKDSKLLMKCVMIYLDNKNLKKKIQITWNPYNNRQKWLRLITAKRAVKFRLHMVLSRSTMKTLVTMPFRTKNVIKCN